MEKLKARGIVWFRQDLRLMDNEAVADAVQSCSEVVYVYIFDSRRWEGRTRYGFSKMGSHLKSFLTEAVRDLKEQIEDKGGHLHILYGHPEKRLLELVMKSNASWVFCNRERTQEEVDVQDRLEKSLWEVGREVRYNRGKMLLYTADLPFPVRQTPDFFTAFRKEVEKITPIRAPIDPPGALFSSKALLEDEWPDLPLLQGEEHSVKGGSCAGMQRWNAFVESGELDRFAMHRKSISDAERTSMMGAYLATGCISPKWIYREMMSYSQRSHRGVIQDSVYDFMVDLLSRDFFRLMGKKHGNKIFLKTGYNSQFEGEGKVDWAMFQRWSQGRTGTPLVDAIMRKLMVTGWISRKARQLAASYLIQELSLPWLMGAEYFESTLVDYDPCSNYGNWAFMAGVGSDTKKDRNYNMIAQSKGLDPQGTFIKTWVPELKNLKPEEVHCPDALEVDKKGLPDIYKDPIIASKYWTGSSHLV